MFGCSAYYDMHTYCLKLTTWKRKRRRREKGEGRRQKRREKREERREKREERREKREGEERERKEARQGKRAEGGIYLKTKQDLSSSGSREEPAFVYRPLAGAHTCKV